MPATCCIQGCKTRGNQKEAKFFRIPKGTDNRGRRSEQKEKRRLAWLKAIDRIDLKNIHNARVCSRHFIRGVPSADDCESYPDWVPTQNLSPPIITRSFTRRSRTKSKTKQNHKKKKRDLVIPEIVVKEEPPKNSIDRIQLSETCEHNYYQKPLANNIDESNNIEEVYIKEEFINIYDEEIDIKNEPLFTE